MSDSPLRIVGQPVPLPEAKAADKPTQLAEAQDSPESTSTQELSTDQQKLEALRELLLRPEREQLDKLQFRFDDPFERAKDFGAILPQVINSQNEQDPQDLGLALAPNIIPALTQVSGRQSEELENALRPVMLPSIRKAIQDALSEFVQAVDQTMKYSFNVQWRIEALRTGQSFAQVVMYHTLLYRVEQALLIHKKTGLLLLEESLPDSKFKDADLVSSLLTAITDFARDSFKADDTQALQKLDHGDLEIWIEGGHGPNDLAILAVVINGNAPETLRTETLQPVLSRILNQRRNALIHFNGDSKPFESCRPDLRSCLKRVDKNSQTPASTQGFRLPPTVAIPLAIFGVLFLIWGLLQWRDHRRWQAYLAQLRNEPGLTITEQEHHYGWLGGRFTLSGLRDPLASDPQALLPTSALNPQRVAAHWQGYYSLDPALVTRRAAQLLEAPESVQFESRDGVLYATGLATRAWITKAQPLARMLPGVLKFDSTQLRDADQERLLAMQRELEKNRLQFITGTPRLVTGQEVELQKMASQLQDAVALANYTQRPLTIEVIGQTDSTGTEAINRPLRLARAQSIVVQLAARGIPNASLIASSGAPQTPSSEQAEAEQQRNRAVTFKITLADPQLPREP